MGIGSNFFKIFWPVLESMDRISILTMGRQELFLSSGVLKVIGRQTVSDLSSLTYFDELAKSLRPGWNVDSMDFSDFEGANVIHDLGRPLEKPIKKQYDFVIDGGTLEHIFDVRSALFNYMRVLKPGGRIFVSTPANNLCGHGFYQFSPELFYNLFREEFGFKLERVLIEVNPFLGGELADGKVYRVEDPNVLGERIMLSNKRPVVLHVQAHKLSETDPYSINHVIQSDYKARYLEAKGGSPRAAAKAKNLAKRIVRPMPRGIRYLAMGLGQRYYYSIHNRRFFKRETLEL